MITYQDYERAENKTEWLQSAIRTYRNSNEYKKALDEQEYMAGRNTAILQMEKVIYNMAGIPETDFTASNIKIRNRLIHRLVTDRCSYSLGNGISFSDQEKEIKDGKTVIVDPVKEELGNDFDQKVYQTAYWAQGNGAAYLYVHKGFEQDEWEYTLFRKTEFLALYDEQTGALRGGVRFWSLDWGKRPITAVLYTEAGYERYETPQKKYGLSALAKVENLRPYIETVEQSEAFGEEVTGTGNLTTLPIFPLYSGENRDSALDNLKPLVDAYDMIISGFANDIKDCAQIYWLVSGAMGMSEGDKRQLLDRLILQHMAVVDGENIKIEPYTQEVPYQARSEALKQLRNQMYENFGGFDVHTVEAGATNDHIEAAYWPMDEEADAFEYQIITFIRMILEMMGIDAVPVFNRNRVSNQKEQTEMIMLAAQYLDDQTILEKLPWISVDEVDDILARKDGENFSRFEDMQTDEEEEDEGGEA
ncbi:MAG: phage portal protein [Bacteroidales bacterium]|nr:phage portal protein [Bacteroidales bacterium]